MLSSASAGVLSLVSEYTTTLTCKDYCNAVKYVPTSPFLAFVYPQMCARRSVLAGLMSEVGRVRSLMLDRDTSQMICTYDIFTWIAAASDTSRMDVTFTCHHEKNAS